MGAAAPSFLGQLAMSEPTVRYIHGTSNIYRKEQADLYQAIKTCAGAGQ
jgi:hypothetical protein